MKVFMFKQLKNMTLFRTFFCAAMLVAMLPMVFSAPALSQQADSLDRLFTIREVKVDERASRGSTARSTALAKAETDAYAKLLLKITQPEGRAMLPELLPGEIQALISGIEVVEEQSSSRRYTATLNVRFEPGNVSQFLAEHNVPHVLSTGRGVTVLHAHSDGVNDFMWTPSPSVFEARAGVDWINRIRQYVFPRGEIRERAAVTFGEVAAMDAKGAQLIAGFMQVQSVLLISTEWRQNIEGNRLFYTFRSVDGDAEGEDTLFLPDNVTEAAALQQALEVILDKIDSEWRDQLLVDTGTGGELTALVPTTVASVLPKVEKRLQDVTLVNDFRILSVGLPFSEVAFRYTGREDQMVLALRYAGLIVDNYGDRRILKLREEQSGGDNE
jgi:hypothetical protein